MEELPEELVHLILGLLDERTLRRSVPHVCRLWRRLARTRGTWRNTVITFEREADFAERVGWTPPAVLALELRRGGAPGCLGEDQWRTVLRCASHARRLTGVSCAGAAGVGAHPHHRGSLNGVLGLGRGGQQCRPGRRLLELLDKCWHSLEHVCLQLQPPLDEDSAQLWTLLASMPRLRRLELTMADSKTPWLTDPDVQAHELCWRWDDGWTSLRHLDLRGLPAGPAHWLLQGFLRVRGSLLRELVLSPGQQLNPRFLRVLKQCRQLEHLGVGCCHDLWRLDALPNQRWLNNLLTAVVPFRSVQLSALTLLGLPRRATALWLLRSPVAARLQSLSLDGVNPSLFDILPAVGHACRSLRSITFRRCQVPARFALPLSACPLEEVAADNMRAEHVLEARRLPRLRLLRLSGHLGNYNSMMAAVTSLRAVNVDLRVAGLEDGLFNNWGPGVQRALALARPTSFAMSSMVRAV
ncbi:Putative F-box/LRR-repeat protein [Frankliniella fusca]|uniref:F-box/LRR-repeat protein n=1 Tax=Frankliniella fusca TaxID=407009 RepID=A0AAE1LEC5_9NEOP|nr:Putative F-box/LRR-repeat protein [Frankliniella fusca]